MNSHTPSGSPSQDATPLQGWRRNIVNILLTVTAIIALPAVGAILLQTMGKPGQLPAAIAFSLCYLLIVALAVVRQIDASIRAWGLLLVGYAVGVLALIRGGLVGDGRTYLIALPPLALVLAGARSGILMAVLSGVTLSVFGLFSQSSVVQSGLVYLNQGNSVQAWLDIAPDFGMILTILMLLLWRFVRFQESTLETERQVSAELGQTSHLLQERAAELESSNARLAEQTELLKTATAMSGQIAALMDEPSILSRFADLMGTQLDLAYLGVFTLNEAGTLAQLRIAYSKFGQAVLPVGHQVTVGSPEPVGQAALGKKTEPAPADLDALRGLAHWRMALPVQVRGRTIGVVDAAPSEARAPSDALQQVLQTLCDQLAISLENARLFQVAQQRAEAEQRASQALERQAWQQVIQQRPDLGVMRNQDGLTAVQSGQALATSGAAGLAVPIKVRDLVVGSIQVRRAEAAWAPEDVALVQAMTDQLGAALEGARLYQDTQRRAAQERLVGQVTSRMRETLDLNTIMQTAVREIAEALDAEQAEVRLGTGADAERSGTGQAPQEARA